MSIRPEGSATTGGHLFEPLRHRDFRLLWIGLTVSLFGGTADFTVAQEFAESATYEQKLALAACLFAVASTDDAISMAEETEIHRITNHLKIQPTDLTALRVAHRRFLPGVGGTASDRSKQ